MLVQLRALAKFLLSQAGRRTCAPKLFQFFGLPISLVQNYVESTECRETGDVEVVACAQQPAKQPICVLHAKKSERVNQSITTISLFYTLSFCTSQHSLVVRILLLYKIQSSIMSGKMDEPLFYDDDEDKKCPPNHPVSRSDPNEVGMKNEASLFYEEEKEEEKEEVKVGDPLDGHTENDSLARNEAPGTAHDLDTKERIEIEDPGTSGGGEDVVFHLRGPDESPGAEAVESQANPPNNPQRRSWFHATTRPGAQRVDGLGNRGHDDDSFTVTIGEDGEVAIEPSPPLTLSAQLINREEEQRRAIQDFLQNAAVADIVPEVAPDKSGRRGKLASFFLVLIVVGVVLAVTLPQDATPATPTTQAPTTTPIPQPLRELISSASSDGGVALATLSTPQNMALVWLAVHPNLETLSDKQIIQKYALATLYYSTNGDTWHSNKFWLSDSEECDGELVCTDTGAVSKLALNGNNLTGTIPPEIGLLTLLGEYVLVAISLSHFGCPFVSTS
jgi:hypothetical protein